MLSSQAPSDDWLSCGAVEIPAEVDMCPGLSFEPDTVQGIRRLRDGVGGGDVSPVCVFYASAGGRERHSLNPTSTSCLLEVY